MTGRIRLTRELAAVVPQLRRASGLHITARRHFSSVSRTRQRVVHDYSSTTTPGRKVSGAVVALAAGLAGYGISNIPSGDAQSKTTAVILDPTQLPPVKYASLEDMKKVTVDQFLPILAFSSCATEQRSKLVPLHRP